MKYKVIKPFNGLTPGDIIELNERRAKSELSNGNVEKASAAKMVKVVYANKSVTRKKKNK